MGSEKRERQKSGRLARIEAEERAARRARSKRRAIQGAVALVVIIGGLFLYTLVFSDDDEGDETATEDTSPENCPPEATPVATSVPYPDPDLAAEVLDRDPPCPEPPPEDTAPDAVETETLIEGEGEGAAEGQTVVVEYIGRIADGTVFDESWSGGRLFDVVLGQGGVIPGWEEGLLGAKAGERRRLVIGSEKAYGPAGQGEIPPDAPLAFEIDVVAILPADAAASSTTAPATPPESAPAESSTTSAP